MTGLTMGLARNGVAPEVIISSTEWIEGRANPDPSFLQRVNHFKKDDG
jgi:hypothetical protein